MQRARSVAAHQKVIHAAIELVAERGVDATSMDSIADTSGVSKATIYKHWPDKEALMLEILAHINGIHSRPAFDSGETRADIVAVLSYRPEENAESRERIMPHFMAYSARHPDFGRAWRQMVMEPPRKELKHLLQKGIGKGELSPEMDIDISQALLLGPMLYWHVFLRRSEVDAAPLAEKIVGAFWRAWSLELKQRPVAARRSRGIRP